MPLSRASFDAIFSHSVLRITDILLENAAYESEYSIND